MAGVPSLDFGAGVSVLDIPSDSAGDLARLRDSMWSLEAIGVDADGPMEINCLAERVCE